MITRTKIGLFALVATLASVGHVASADPPRVAPIPTPTSPPPPSPGQVTTLPPNITALITATSAKEGKKVISFNPNAPLLITTGVQPGKTAVEITNATRVNLNVGMSGGMRDFHATFKSSPSGAPAASVGKVKISSIPVSKSTMVVVDCPVTGTTAKPTYTYRFAGPNGPGPMDLTKTENPFTQILESYSTASDMQLEITVPSPTDVEWTWTSCKIYSFPLGN